MFENVPDGSEPSNGLPVQERSITFKNVQETGNGSPESSGTFSNEALSCCSVKLQHCIHSHNVTHPIVLTHFPAQQSQWAHPKNTPFVLTFNFRYASTLTMHPQLHSRCLSHFQYHNVRSHSHSALTLKLAYALTTRTLSSWANTYTTCMRNKITFTQSKHSFYMPGYSHAQVHQTTLAQFVHRHIHTQFIHNALLSHYNVTISLTQIPGFCLRHTLWELALIFTEPDEAKLLLTGR